MTITQSELDSITSLTELEDIVDAITFDPSDGYDGPPLWSDPAEDWHAAQDAYDHMIYG